MRRQRERGRNDPVEALSALEAQVVPDHLEVQPRLPGPLEETSRCFRRLPEDRVVNVKADSDQRMTADVRRSSFAMTRFWISAVPSAIR